MWEKNDGLVAWKREGESRFWQQMQMTSLPDGIFIIDQKHLQTCAVHPIFVILILVPFVNPLGWQCWFLFKQLNSRQTDFSHIWLAYKEENAFQSLAVTETIYVWVKHVFVSVSSCLWWTWCHSCYSIWTQYVIHKFKLRVKWSKAQLQPCILYITQVSALSHN